MPIRILRASHSNNILISENDVHGAESVAAMRVVGRQVDSNLTRCYNESFTARIAEVERLVSEAMSDRFRMKPEQ